MLPLPRRCRDVFLKGLPLTHRYRDDLYKKKLPPPLRTPLVSGSNLPVLVIPETKMQHSALNHSFGLILDMRQTREQPNPRMAELRISGLYPGFVHA